MVRVVLVDDQRGFIDAVKYTLERSGEVEVIGWASNGREGYELCKQQKPDLVLMDLRMPVCDGIEGTQLIKKYDPSIKILVLTTFNEDADIFKALQNGADGYVLKEMETSELVSAIKGVMGGLGVIDDNVLRKVSRMLNTSSSEDVKTADECDLLGREIEVMKFVVDGMSNKEIAAKLNYS
ncbi:MAG TPA: response regulator transcription factor, partial [Clostridia bacterium]